MATAKAPSATNLTFALLTAIIVSGKALVNGVAVPGPMPVSFVRLEGGSVPTSTDTSGAYIAFLAPGNYSVQLSGTNNATSGGVSRFFQYAFTGSLTIPSDALALAFDLLVTRTLDNTTVSGTVSRSGIGVDATVSFFARGGGSITSQAAADSSGIYSVSLAPGTYDAYVTRASRDSALLARITVPHATSFAQNLALANAFRLSGVTLNAQEAGTAASITIQSGGQLNLTSDAQGAYQVVLPTGLYTIESSTTVIEHGISVTYRTASAVQVTIKSPADALVDHGTILVAATSRDAGTTVGNVEVRVDIQRVRSLALSLDPGSAVFDGGFLNDTLVVKNSGNAAETVTVMITNPDDLVAVGGTANLAPPTGSATGPTLTGVTVPANSTVRVRLQAQSASGASGATAVVQVFAQDSMAVSATSVFTLRLPALDSGAPTVSGPDITSTAPFNLQILAAVVGAVAAVGAGFFLTRRRR